MVVDGVGLVEEKVRVRVTSDLEVKELQVRETEVKERVDFVVFGLTELALRVPLLP